MTKSKVVVTQNQDELVPPEVLAKSIKEISSGVKKLRKGSLSDKTIILLIHDKTKVSKGTIKKVLDGLENLTQDYLKEGV